MSGKKVVVSFVLGMGILWMFPSMSSVVNAETEGTLQEERSELQSELNEKRKDLEEIQLELVEIEEDIDLIDEVIESNDQEVAKTEANIEEKEGEISALEEEIDQLEDDIDRRHNLLKDRASALQKNGGSISYLDVLFGAQSFTDFIDRVSLVTRITQSDQSLLEQLYVDQEEVEEQKQLVDDKLAELEDTKLELEHIQELTLEQKAQQEDKLEQLEEKKAQSEALVAELEIEDREIEQMIEEARRVAAEQEEQNIVQYSSESDDTPQVTPSVQTTNVASGNIGTIIGAGKRYIGNSRYKWGGGRSQSDISKGLFDCSGFVSWAFGQGGVSVPASTGALAGTGTKVSTSDMQPGDIVFFDTNGTNGHVGIYLGGGEFIGAQSSTGVAKANMSSGYWADYFSGHVRRIVK
ncbi:coiled-coil domain-containing protein [Amphibacillus sp. Q70]|uniref:coiled-coil domain-containing protein n=1 Tax=Amphibacillus sp. Q70 TaxID=3453416 RepID=UPI003F833592